MVCHSFIHSFCCSLFVQVGLLTGNLWPNGWELYQQFRPVAFLPSRYEMIFILNEHHNFDQELSIMNIYSDDEQQQRFQSKRLINNNNKNQTENFVQKSPILIWNNLDAINWNQSWRTKLLDFEPPVRFTGMFEMNGIVYAIGEQIHSNSVRRIGKMYQYYVTDNDGRNFKELVRIILFACKIFFNNLLFHPLYIESNCTRIFWLSKIENFNNNNYNYNETYCD